ncbi:hypothetical protein DXF91_24645, partial [Enterobacter roggenkampii]
DVYKRQLWNQVMAAMLLTLIPPVVIVLAMQRVARRNFSHRNALNYAPQQESEKQLLRTVQIKTPRCLSHSNDEAGNLR